MTRIPFSCFKLSLLGRHWSVPLCKFQGFDPMTPHLHPPPSVRPLCGAPDRVALLARPRRPAACAREVVCLSHSRVCRLPFYVPHARERTRLSSFFVSFVSPGAALPRPVRAARMAARHGAESRGAHAPRRPRPVLRGRSLRSSPRPGHREEGCDECRGAGARTALRIRVFAFSRWCRMGGRRVARQRSTDC